MSVKARDILPKGSINMKRTKTIGKAVMLAGFILMFIGVSFNEDVPFSCIFFAVLSGTVMMLSGAFLCEKRSVRSRMKTKNRYSYSACEKRLSYSASRMEKNYRPSRTGTERLVRKENFA